ncbi:MAG: DNA-directed RNA polymerase subunit B'' [archaeon]
MPETKKDPSREHILVKKYFKEHSFIEANLNSFDKFLEKELQLIVDEIGDIIPSIIPQDVQDFRIKFDKIWVEKPQIVEADGSKRDIYPIEARLRKLTYAAPIYLDVSVHIDGIQRESFISQIGKMPIMLRSKYCHLHKLSEEDLIKQGEDPNDSGGYFILNGNERVMITVEDLLPNKVFVQKNTVGPSKYTLKVFSQRGSYSIPHMLEQMKDGILYLSFTRFKRIPVLAVIKALGLTKDQDIMELICDEKEYDDMYINFYKTATLKTEEEALEFISNKIGMTQPKEVRLKKAKEQIDNYLLPHIGVTSKDSMLKAYNLCKYVKKFLRVTKDRASLTDKDHYQNKKLKLSGDLLADLLRVNMRVLINDILYNFQRLVKRGKFQSVKIIIRDKLLTSRIKSAMATGSWVGGRKGISQNIDRVNFISSMSHLCRVVSLLSATQENFEARALHSTHWGRLCPIETPEGTPIGLKKNMALLCQISQDDINEEKLKKSLEGLGLILVR